jgi:hypothetical protein
MSDLERLWTVSRTSRLILQLIERGDVVFLTRTTSGWFWGEQIWGEHGGPGIGHLVGRDAKEKAMEQAEAYLLAKLSAHQRLEVRTRAAAAKDDFGEWLATQGSRLKSDFEIDL